LRVFCLPGHTSLRCRVVINRQVQRKARYIQDPKNESNETRHIHHGRAAPCAAWLRTRCRPTPAAHSEPVCAVEALPKTGRYVFTRLLRVRAARLAAALRARLPRLAALRLVWLEIACRLALARGSRFSASVIARDRLCEVLCRGFRPASASRCAFARTVAGLLVGAPNFTPARTCLGQTNCDGLVAAIVLRALPLANVMYLFSNEFSCLRRRRLALGAHLPELAQLFFRSGNR